MDAEQIGAELKRINDSIPYCYKKDLLKEVLVAPAVLKVIKEALKDSKLDQEKRLAYENLLATGDLETKTLQEDPTKVSKINKWVEKEIQKSIKAGRLPPREEIDKLPFIQEMKKKYENQKR